jgi:hypothetical protein
VCEYEEGWSVWIYGCGYRGWIWSCGYRGWIWSVEMQHEAKVVMKHGKKIIGRSDMQETER